MKNLFLCCALLISSVGMEAHASLANENNPQNVCIPLGSPSVDAVVLGGASLGKARVVSSARLLNAAGIAASNTDYVILQLKKGSTVVASLDTRAAGQGAVTANVSKAMVVASATIASGDVVSVNYDETDSGTAVALTGAVLCMDYVVK